MASLTINFTVANGTRLKAAMESAFQIENATVADVKNYIIRDLKQFVREVERRLAKEAAIADLTDVDLT